MVAAATPADTAAVRALLGREPAAAFEVVVRGVDGQPVVLRNAPFTFDGTPMPTRYWLVDPALHLAIARLEADGGVRRAAADVDPDELAAAHVRYAVERNTAIPAGRPGPRPSGGVGGTRVGVKCLHAHYAWHLAGGDDPVGRWIDDRLAEAATGQDAVSRVAAVDIGTNSVRLLVAEVDGDPAAPIVTLDRRMRITRLGQGVNASRRLAPEAIERTLGVLREYRGAIDELGVERVRATATSAARDSENRDEFFGPATAVLGVRPELLSGDEEARLSFVGATTGLDAPRPVLVVDIGGGSTEFVIGAAEPEALRSLDVGCVRITEQWLRSDPPAPEELSNAVSAVRDELADLARELPSLRDAATVVGLAGTITTVAAIEQGLAEYDRDRIHHFRLTARPRRTCSARSRSSRRPSAGTTRDSKPSAST